MPVAPAYNPRNAALYHPERQDTLFETTRSYSIPQLAVEAARLAYYRAEKSAAERTRLAEALARVGFADPALFSDPRTGVAAFIAVRTDGTTLLSFRGTQPDNYKDLITDLRAGLVEWPEARSRIRIRHSSRLIDRTRASNTRVATRGSFGAMCWCASWRITLPRITRGWCSRGKTVAPSGRDCRDPARALVRE